MVGDYNRYKAEISTGADREAVIQKSLDAYVTATEIATKLPSTHPIRLGLALNFSVFNYEIKCDCATACRMAKEAFNSAMEQLDHLKDENYKDSTLIMQLLRDNLTVIVFIFKN